MAEGTHVDLILRRWFIGSYLISKFRILGFPTKSRFTEVPLHPRLCPTQPVILGFLRTVIVKYEPDNAHFQGEVDRFWIDHHFAKIYDGHFIVISYV